MTTLSSGDNMVDAIIIVLLSFVALSIVGSVALFILTIVAQFWRKP
tara:strand:- start:328 stop:465 length:138 start_codon:yes stop_codon:yes gene_type:complete